MTLSTALVVLAVVAGAVVLLALALAPALGRRVPDDVVAPPRTGYGVVTGRPVVPVRAVATPATPCHAAPRRRQHDLAA